MVVNCWKCETPNKDDARYCAACKNALKADVAPYVSGRNISPVTAVPIARRAPGRSVSPVAAAPITRRAPGVLTIALGVALGLATFAVCTPVCGLLGLATTAVMVDTDTRPQAPEKKHIDPAKQRKRKRFIQQMIADGYWQKTEFTGSLPKVWVNDSFLFLGETRQNKFLEVAYAYWMGELDSFGLHADGFIRDSLVIKKDNGTLLGRRIGTYNPINGFQ